MQASGSLVDVDFPWPGIDIFCTSMGLGRQIVRELDLKLTLGWLRGNKLSLSLMRNHGEGVIGSNLGQTQSHPLSESGCFLSNRSQYRLNIARTLNKDKKNVN